MFNIKTEKKTVSVKKIQGTYTKSMVNELIREHALKEHSIEATKIVWNANGTMTVEGKPSTAKKLKELEAEAAEKEGQK